MLYLGKLRYANNSNYKNDTMIRKEAYVHKAVLEELQRIIEDSEIMKEDDTLWPNPDRVGRQVLLSHFRFVQALCFHLKQAVYFCVTNWHQYWYITNGTFFC